MALQVFRLCSVDNIYTCYTIMASDNMSVFWGVGICPGEFCLTTFSMEKAKFNDIFALEKTLTTNHHN